VETLKVLERVYGVTLVDGDMGQFADPGVFEGFFRSRAVLSLVGEKFCNEVFSFL